MNCTHTIQYLCKPLLQVALIILIPHMLFAQQTITINMTPIDGVSITPANILSYHVQSSFTGNVQISGAIRYRNSDLRMSYTFNSMLHQGMNTFTPDATQPQWQFSTSALQELFFAYNIMPAGTFEYCVTINPSNTIKENNTGPAQECLYHRADDIFLINLIEPINKAKLKEFNPMLTWVANYSFATQLTYRLRIAEIKQGQNPINAIMRNQSMYDDKNLIQNTTIYPIFAKPLTVNQPYAWTVDAYYKGILLGGAETWQFIIPDTVAAAVKANRSYIDIKRESGLERLSAIGSLKLKYILDDATRDSLYIELMDERNKKRSITPDKLEAIYGDNRYELNLAEYSSLKHKANYILQIRTKTGHEYKLTFQYLNPEYLR